MRIIVHVDMNSFFASVAQQANHRLRGKPIAVTGGPGERAIIMAASREAKKFGVKTAMSIREGKATCPDLILVPGEFSQYIEIHERFMDIARRYTDLVEIFSIDEFFADVTDYAARWVDTSVPKQDQLWIGAQNMMLDFKQRLRAEAGEVITCSVGIAANKSLAKLASDMRKPDGLITIRPEQARDVLVQTPLKDICGIGRRIEKRLRILGVHTMRQLADFPYPLLKQEFGKHTADFLSHVAIGEDDAPVVPEWRADDQKSFGHDHTVSEDLRTPEEVQHILRVLSEKVGRRLRNAGKHASLVFWRLRWADFSSSSGAVRVPEPVAEGKDIFRYAWEDIDSHGLRDAVRLVGVGVADVRTPMRQLNLLHDTLREQRLSQAMDRINDRFGEFTVRPAALTEHSLGTKKMGTSLQKKFDRVLKHV